MPKLHIHCDSIGRCQPILRVLPCNHLHHLATPLVKAHSHGRRLQVHYRCWRPARVLGTVPAASQVNTLACAGASRSTQGERISRQMKINQWRFAATNSRIDSCPGLQGSKRVTQVPVYRDLLRVILFSRVTRCLCWYPLVQITGEPISAAPHQRSTNAYFREPTGSAYSATLIARCGAWRCGAGCARELFVA